MQKDAVTDRKQVLCPNASTLGYGKWKAQLGDFIVCREHYMDGTHENRLGRVIGRVDYAPALDGHSEPTRNHLIVIGLADMPTFGFERWVSPDDVIEVLGDSGQVDKMRRLMEWFLSPELPKHSTEELIQWIRSGFPTMDEWIDYKRNRTV